MGVGLGYFGLTKVLANLGPPKNGCGSLLKALKWGQMRHPNREEDWVLVEDLTETTRFIFWCTAIDVA